MASYSSLSDYELALLLKEGNSMAFTEIYNRYKGLLYSHAYKRLLDKEEAKDVIHELFATLWNKHQSIEFSGHLSGYLYTSVRNRVIDVIAKKQTQLNYISGFQNHLQQGEAVTDHLVRERQLAAIIEKEVALLPPKMREVFELSRKVNLSHREIGEQLNISELTVKKHVNNALKILRGKLTCAAYLAVVLYFLRN